MKRRSAGPDPATEWLRGDDPSMVDMKRRMVGHLMLEVDESTQLKLKVRQFIRWVNSATVPTW